MGLLLHYQSLLLADAGRGMKRYKCALMSLRYIRMQIFGNSSSRNTYTYIKEKSNNLQNERELHLQTVKPG